MGQNIQGHFTPVWRLWSKEDMSMFSGHLMCLQVLVSLSLCFAMLHRQGETKWRWRYFNCARIWRRLIWFNFSCNATWCHLPQTLCWLITLMQVCIPRGLLCTLSAVVLLLTSRLLRWKINLFLCSCISNLCDVIWRPKRFVKHMNSFDCSSLVASHCLTSIWSNTNAAKVVPWKQIFQEVKCNHKHPTGWNKQEQPPESPRLLRLGADTRGRQPIRGIYSVKVQSGLLFSPKSSQISPLFPGWARGEAGQSPQVQRREDDSLSSAGLSSSCVALRLSASGFPRGPWLQLHPQQHRYCCAVGRAAWIRTDEYQNGTDGNLWHRYNRRVCALWSEGSSDASGHSPVTFFPERARLLTPGRGANTEVEPERSKVKRLSSGLSRGLSVTSVNRRIIIHLDASCYIDIPEEIC